MSRANQKPQGCTLPRWKRSVKHDSPAESSSIQCLTRQNCIVTRAVDIPAQILCKWVYRGTECATMIRLVLPLPLSMPMCGNAFKYCGCGQCLHQISMRGNYTSRQEDHMTLDTVPAKAMWALTHANDDPAKRSSVPRLTVSADSRPRQN